MASLTADIAPVMVEAFGIGPDTAAEMLIVAGDNPDRVRSESAWAKLCGVCPVPASSGKMSRFRLNRGGHRQANAAPVPHRHRADALPPADDRLRRPPDSRGQDQGRDHPLSEALRGSGGLGLPAPAAPSGARFATPGLTT